MKKRIEIEEDYNFYEYLCYVTEEMFKISPWKSLNKEYKKAIIFSHLKITPEGAFSLTILATALTIVIPTLLMITFNFLHGGLLLFIGIFAAIVFYYLYTYPMHYATVFRIKASSEMTLCILYMVTSMKISPNLERAIEFATRNLRGPLALDLKKLLWEIYAGKYTTEQGLDVLMEKWERENEEFTEALYLIKNSPFVAHKKQEDILDEAIWVILAGTKDRMKGFARKLRTPVLIINTMGILLPLLGVVFFPLMAMFLPELIQPYALGIGYTVILPFIVYALMKKYLEERPYSFHQPDLSQHPKFKKEKPINKELITTIVICFLFSLMGIMLLLPIKLFFSAEQLYLSLIVTWGIAAGIIYYCITTVRNKLELREEIIKIESEFGEALYQLGSRSTMGIPLENVLKEIVPKIKHLKISKFFKNIIYNIENFGMTLERAVFDKKTGAINYYPSVMIDALMRAIIGIQKRGGFRILSKITISISTYLKNIKSVEEDLNDMLGEVTASLHIQSILLAPLTAGIVVALAAIIMEMLIMFGGVSDPLYNSMEGYGVAGAAGGGLLTAFINLDEMIPIHIFQIIVGIYMIEIVVLMTIFLSLIENGDENILKRSLIGRRLLISTILYTIIMILVYSMFTALIPVKI